MTVALPFVIRNGSYKISTVEYNSIITKAKLVPSQDVQTLMTAAPAGIIQDVGPVVWVWQVTFGTDWTASTGLAAILNAAAITGGTLDCIMAPKLLGPNATFTIKAKAVDFGGDVGSFNTTDAEFPVEGAPVFGVDA